MSDEAKTIPTYGYGKDGPKLFQLKEGKGLPKGYYDHPDKVPQDEPAATDGTNADAAGSDAAA
jgi:hypothetical protein